MDKYIVSKTNIFSKRFNKIAYLMLCHVMSRNPLGPHFTDTLNSISSFKIKYYKSKGVSWINTLFPKLPDSPKDSTK